jgi:hypothetical protein
MPATYDSATIKRARTILANAERQQAARKAAVKRTVKPTVKADSTDDAWRKFAASKRQMDRINLAYGHLNLRTFRTLADFRAVFPTMGAASDEFQRPTIKSAYYAAR